jgi:hypothetical protein
VDENNKNRVIRESIFALIRRGILGYAALPSYFMGSMREDRNQAPFLHFPHISLPQTKPLSRCPTTPISNQKRFRGESSDSEFWGMLANKCFYIYWYYAKRWGRTTDFETGRLYMSLKTVGCFHFYGMTSTRVTGLYHMIVDTSLLPQALRP